jgi:predicted O-linked N-acetylglucosamine transferase (SPINDLY family)
VYLQQHHHVDFCLDTFPFSGLTTALHSLWMGVPTLTLPGNTVPGRSGLTAMSHAGLDMFIAQDEDDFVRRGVELANDIPALAALRAGMRERCERSPMFQPAQIASGVSQALRVMWRRWCEGLPAESFEIKAANAQQVA